MLIETVHAGHRCNGIVTFTLRLRCGDERRRTRGRTEKIIFLLIAGARGGCGRSREHLVRFVHARLWPYVALGAGHQPSQDIDQAIDFRVQIEPCLKVEELFIEDFTLLCPRIKAFIELFQCRVRRKQRQDVIPLPKEVLHVFLHVLTTTEMRFRYVMSLNRSLIVIGELFHVSRTELQIEFIEILLPLSIDRALVVFQRHIVFHIDSIEEAFQGIPIELFEQ